MTNDDIERLSRESTAVQLQYTQATNNLNAILHGFAYQLVRLHDIIDRYGPEKALPMQIRYVGRISRHFRDMTASAQAVVDQMQEEIDAAFEGQ